MKTRWIAMALSLLSSTLALADELPAHWCSASSIPCSDQQVAIWNKFFESTTPLLDTSTPAVFTGDCYYHSYFQDPKVRGYGVAVFDRSTQQDPSAIHYGGSFAQFFDSNPWADLTIDQARAQGLIRFEDRFKLNMQPDHASASVSSSPEHFIFYWFRQDPTGRKLYLLGQADGIVLSFCELNRNN